MRARTGKTGAEFAGLLGDGWRQSRISKIETGTQLPSEDDLRTWAKAAGAEAEPLIALRQQAASDYRSDRERHRRAGGALAHQTDLTALAENCERFGEF